jgi:two-component system nitrate/nitrite response regulator NarL
MRLVLCDDHVILAGALAVGLEARGHKVLAVTRTPTAGIAAVEALRPDICLLDVHFPEDGNGLDAARAICQRYPRTKVLMLAATADPQTVGEAAKAGVAGYILKDQSVSEISETLDLIGEGKAVFSPGLRRRGNKGQSHGGLDVLTPREKEVLARMVVGESTVRIAQGMGVTTGTVRIYVGNVLAKLGVHTRLQAAAVARELSALNHHGARCGPGQRSGSRPTAHVC